MKRNGQGGGAVYSVTVVDQASAAPEHAQKKGQGRAVDMALGFGWAMFLPLERLRARPGFLAGDRLLLRVHLEVVP